LHLTWKSKITRDGIQNVLTHCTGKEMDDHGFLEHYYKEGIEYQCQHSF